MRTRSIRIQLAALILVIALGAWASQSCAPAAGDAQKVTTWRFATHLTPTDLPVVAVKRAQDKVTEKSNGRLKFQMQYGKESGFEAKDYVTALEKGMTDAALMPMAMQAFDYPWLDVLGLPGVIPDLKARETMVKAIAPVVDDFFKEHGIISLFDGMMPRTAWIVLYSNKQIKSPADFKGMLIRAHAPSSLAVIKSLGAVPVELGSSEVYLGLQKGTIEGAVTGAAAAEGQKLDEVSKHALKFYPYLNHQRVGVSKMAWDKLPADLQTMVRDTFAEWGKGEWVSYNDPAEQAKEFEYHRQRGMTVSELSPEFAEPMNVARKEAIGRFVAASGDKGQRMIDAVNKALVQTGYSVK